MLYKPISSKGIAITVRRIRVVRLGMAGIIKQKAKREIRAGTKKTSEVVETSEV
jgi:hypothetical protein